MAINTFSIKLTKNNTLPAAQAMLYATGLKENVIVGFKFKTIGISDGMGTSGMRYSLPSRELIADTIESVVKTQHYDGLMLKPTSYIMGANLSQKIALITDGRFSVGSHGFVVGNITPEAQNGVLIALIENGDIIIIDAIKNTITLKIN